MQLGTTSSPHVISNFVDRVRNPPPPYEPEDGAAEKPPQDEERSTFRRICQIIVILSALALAITWSYFYISKQASNPPFAGPLIAELVLLTLYVAMLGFFTFVFMLRAVFPVLVNLGAYAAHGARGVTKVFAVLGILGIWGACLLWVVGVPLIPGVAGVIVRNAASS